jgi:hypothetical protein
MKDPLHNIFHQPVNRFVAWSGIMAIVYMGLLPGILFAQEGTFPTDQPTNFGTTPVFDVVACNQKCEVIKRECAANAGTDNGIFEMCSAKAVECYNACAKQSGTLPPPITTVPDVKPQFQPPQGPSPEACLKEKCEPLKRECLAKAGEDKEAMVRCEQMVGQCVSSCQAPNQQQGGFQQGMPGGNFQQQQGDFKPQGEIQQCQLDRIKKQMLQSSRQLAKIKTRVTALAKKGVKIPQELTGAFAKVDDIMAKVKAAEDCQALVELEIGDVMEETGEIIREQLPNLERLSQLTKIYGRVDKQIKTFDKYLVQDKALAKRSKVDINDAVAAFEADLVKLKEAYAAAKAKIGAGEVEDGFGMLESDVFDAMDSVGEHHGIIQQIGRLSAGISQADREIRNNQRQLDALKKAKKEIAEAQGILDDGKAKIAELKTAAAAKPIDPDTVLGLLQEMEDIRDRFAQALNTLKGIKETEEIDTGITFTAPPEFNLDLGGL